MPSQTQQKLQNTTTQKRKHSTNHRLDADTLFELLQSERRRHLFRALKQHHTSGDSFPMADLADEVTAIENDKPIKEITSNERQRVYTSLYQTHLPKLDDYDLIDYDSDQQVVVPTDAALWVGQYLKTADKQAFPSTDDTQPWTRRFLGASLISGAASTVQTGLIAGVSIPVLEYLPPAVLFGMAAWYTVDNYRNTTQTTE